jgi:hypothetical protein
MRRRDEPLTMSTLLCAVLDVLALALGLWLI